LALGASALCAASGVVMAAAAKAEPNASKMTIGVSRLHNGTSPPAKRTRWRSALSSDGDGAIEKAAGGENTGGAGGLSAGGSLGGSTSGRSPTSVFSLGSASPLGNPNCGKRSPSGDEAVPKRGNGSLATAAGAAEGGGGGGSEGGGREARAGGGGGSGGTDPW